MKVSIGWLKELVDLNCSIEELVALLPLRSIGTKEVTDDFIELDMKGYNRSDLLSMRGVAYEVAAITDSKIAFEEPREQNYVWDTHDLANTPIVITDEFLSPMQAVAKIENLKVAPSPKAWMKKLEDSGIRSVNNIVDITNLIMLEYGQPLHSFDADEVDKDTIIVRYAVEDEEVLTLDGKIRKLNKEDIVLADSKNALDVAGVMGGKASEVTGKTSNILLSASIFNPVLIRQTSQRLGLASEASKRFYHGLTKKRLLQAFDSAIKMYESIGGKVTAVTIAGNTEENIQLVNLNQEKVNSLVGIEISEKDIENYLEKLYFVPKKNSEKVWEVKVPYWRLDIEQEVDLIEEVARMYGYEKIPAKPLENKLPKQKSDPVFDLITKIKLDLVQLGLTEVQSYSFYTARSAHIFFNTPDKLVKILNPISVETEFLRNYIFPNLIQVIEKNINQGFNDIAIFEIGKTYFLGDVNTSAPKEKYKLSILLMNDTNQPCNELVQIFEKISVFDNKNLEFQHIKTVDLVSYLNKDTFHPSRYYEVLINNKPVGTMAEVHPRILNMFGINKRVAILEIELEPLI